MESAEYYKTLMRTAAAALPKVPSFKVPLSMRLVANMRLPIVERNKPAGYMFIGSTVWSYLIGDEDFQKMFDPVTRHELVMLGHLGTMLGMEVFTDGFFEPDERIFEQNLLAIAAVEYPVGDIPVVYDVTAIHCDTPANTRFVVDVSTVKQELSAAKKQLSEEIAGLLAEIKVLNARST